MDELVEMAQKQISAQWGIYTIDDFLDKSKRSVDSDTDFGTRREHTADYTLRKLLEENNLLFEFILLYRFVTEQNDA
ncbi:MAG: hypothetical protein BWY70_01512 [Bacteroidetes bacterium ADurb.Bin408]|nr:MAG: hypothetical protein BWY70_01512 [Bacteroidetes bacterium ADurb.Bin408]